MAVFYISKLKNFPRWKTATFFTPELDDLTPVLAEATFYEGKPVVIDHPVFGTFTAIYFPISGITPEREPIIIQIDGRAINVAPLSPKFRRAVMADMTLAERLAAADITLDAIDSMS